MKCDERKDDEELKIVSEMELVIQFQFFLNHLSGLSWDGSYWLEF